MFSLISSPLKVKLPKVLHLIHPRDVKNPAIAEELSVVKSDSSAICRVGEHHLTDQRWDEFDTIILHSCADDLRKDYLKKLGEFQDRLQDVAEDSAKRLMIYGNAIQLTGDTVFMIPHQGNVVINDATTIGDIDIDTEGLNITGIIADYDFSTTTVSKKYIECVKYLSKHDKIWLLSPQTTVTSDGIIRSGHLTLVDKGKITTVKRCYELKDDSGDEQSNRKIKPITPVYKD